jgi:exopolyphosphatase/guanosine-5'-triphosphate,3'-diphosphate pyrophosphatase
MRPLIAARPVILAHCCNDSLDFFRMADKILLAAVDLGSNSFRLLIGQTSGQAGVQVGAPGLKTIDSAKRSVRLAAGLDRDLRLDPESQRRALEALASFADRLRSYAPDVVRAIATNTLRVARNARHFLASAEAVIGVPIEVISGHEEARLIYRGAAQVLPDDGHRRLVIDIGGGSTECIIGQGHEPVLLESIEQGCVAATSEHLTAEPLLARDFEAARHHAQSAFDTIAQRYRQAGWRYAVGTSGTAKALCQIAREQFGNAVLDRTTLNRMVGELLATGSASALGWHGLKPERRAVLAGGLAVMAGAFDAFDIDSIDYCSGALRQGVLFDLLDRRAGVDHRTLTVQRLCARHQVDPRYGQALSAMTLALFDQAARADREALSARRQLLGWACLLSEVGMSISHHHHHRHSAYILEHGDLPGFSQDEQEFLATLTLSQAGGLRKLRGRIPDELGWIAVLSLRLATIILRGQVEGELPVPALFFKRKSVRLEMPAAWAKLHPAASEALADEAVLWTSSRIFERFDYVQLSGPR